MLESLQSETFDVLVAGGGITGVGVALDAAARGLRTALVERHDFASGTSSRSSKMVHGGLRYLEQRDFRLVYEALHERQRLIENAPHLVSPLPFLIPLFGRQGVAGKGLAAEYSTALWIYDLTGGLRIGHRHLRVGRDDALTHLPTLRTDRLAAGFLYFDARADDARLTLAIARTAAIDHGASVANYVEVTGLLHDKSGKVAGVAARDTIGGKTFEVRARAVVNATGIWSDDVRALDEGAHPRSIRPAKGIHVTIPAERLPADIAAVIPVRRDKRSIFIVPWPDGGDVYAGTTDTDWDGSLDDPACLPEDVDYVVEAISHWTREPVGRRDVTGVWTGLRPLLAPAGGKHVSARTADMSRRHTVRTSQSGLVTVTGGKLTTYRRMAEDTMAAVLRVLGGAFPGLAGRCPTRRLRLRGSEDPGLLRQLLRPSAAAGSGLDSETFAHLVRRYGTEVPEVLALAGDDAGLLGPLVKGLPYLRVEALWSVREEMAENLDDLLSRRTRAVLRRALDTADAAEDVASLVAPEWGLSAGQASEQAAAFASNARRDLDRAGLGGAR
jgi:glycerol-3-phosphate dehydrogenase